MDAIAEVQVPRVIPTLVSPLNRDDTRTRAELARWLDWGEAPWFAFDQTMTQVPQVSEVENVSR